MYRITQSKHSRGRVAEVEIIQPERYSSPLVESLSGDLGLLERLLHLRHVSNDRLVPELDDVGLVGVSETLERCELR